MVVEPAYRSNGIEVTVLRVIEAVAAERESLDFIC